MGPSGALGTTGAYSIRPTGRRRRILVVSAVLLVLAAVWAAWAAWAAVTARDALLDARSAVQDLDPSSQSAEQVAVTLSTAASDARRAERRLDGLGPRLASAVPVVGRSWAASHEVARTAAELLGLAERAWPQVDAARSEQGDVDLDALAELADTLEAAAPQVAAHAEALARTPLSGTPAAVRRAVEDARAVLLPAASAVDASSDALGVLSGLLGGDRPRTVVVGIMNNAEVRGAGGYVPSVAVVRTDDGAVDVGPFIDTNLLDDPPATAVPVPAAPEFSERWGRYLADTTVWKNATMSPHVPDVASVLCELARLRPGVPCDAVVLVDVPALAEVMALDGPVQLGEEQLQGDALVRALLVDAYADAEDLGLAQAERRARLLAAADAAVTQLLDRQLTALPVLRLLARNAAGRHLVLWSADDDEQRTLERLDLAGSADPAGADLSLVSLNQLSAGKLDYYLRREVEVEVVVHRDVAEVEQRVRLALDHPDALPQYVLGVAGGELRHLVDLGLSPRAGDVQVRLDGDPVPYDLVEDDRGSTRVAAYSSLLDGRSHEFTMRYTVPVDDGRYRLELVPQPLTQDASLVVRVLPAPGLELDDGPVHVREPFARARSVEVEAGRPSWWERRVELPG